MSCPCGRQELEDKVFDLTKDINFKYRAGFMGACALLSREQLYNGSLLGLYIDELKRKLSPIIEDPESIAGYRSELERIEKDH